MIQETPYKIGEALNGASGLNIDEEKRLIDEKLNQLHEQGTTEDAIKEAMKDMGIQRFVLKITLSIYIYIVLNYWECFCSTFEH